MNDIIVTCNGCFDGLHPGHLFFLGFCRALGTRLIVGINCDEYIAKNKRPKPFYSAKKRKQMLMNLGIIDNVVVFTEDNPVQFIVKIKPDIHCTGEEYRNNCAEEKICNALNIKLFFVPRISQWSTTGIIDPIHK